MANVITGFMTYAVTMSDIGLVLTQMHQVVEARAKKECKALLQDQAEVIVDEIALNRVTIPQDQTVYGVAVTELVRRMVSAEQKMENIEYNLSASCQCFAGKDKDGNPCTYIQMFCPNDIYSDLLVKKVAGLIPFHMKQPDHNTDKKHENQKAKKWNEIMEYYEGLPVLGTKLITYEQVIPPVEELVFRSPVERAADLAQKYTLDCLLGMYATGNQIQPHKLMEFMMLALKRLQNADIQAFEAKKKEELLRILPHIDQEMVTTPGGCAMKKHEDAVPVQEEPGDGAEEEAARETKESPEGIPDGKEEAEG